MDFRPAVGGLYLDLYFAGTASGGGDPQPAHKKQWFCDLYLYSAYVDEFFVKDHRMAVTIGKNRCDQPDHPVVRTAGPEYDQHRGGSSPWHGIQLSAVYGAAGVQCVHEDP